MKNDSHLTVLDETFERKVHNSQAGMAHFAGTGPPNTTCRTCLFYGSHEVDLHLRPGVLNRCAKYIELTKRVHGRGIEPGTPSCWYYQQRG